MAPDRMWGWRRGSALAALVLGVFVLGVLAVSGSLAIARSGRSPAALAQSSQSTTAQPVPAGDWLTFDYNAQRTGVGPTTTGITASNLHRLKRETIALDGTVDSSPVELHAVTIDGRTRDVIIMTTDYGRTMALDANTGARLWQYQEPSYAQLAGSPQITTATPVIDPDLEYVYVSTPDGFIHKLRVSNGRQVWAARITYNPSHEKIAGSLNISGSSVIAVTGGYIGDIPPYQGHVVLIDRQTGRVTAIWNSLCSNRHHLIRNTASCPASDSAIFGRPGSILEPDGDILVATGNAPFNGHTNWGDSVLELSPELKLLHNYTPTDQAYLNTNDVDLGSTSPALLDNRHGAPLAVMAGKDGLIKLLNLDRLDGTRGPAGPRTGGQLQEIPAPGTQNVFSQPAVWKSPSGQINVFYTTAGGTADYVLGANRRLHVRWQDGTSGTSPLIAGGLLYVYDFEGGRLDIYRPASGRLLDSLPAAPGHWNSPIVVGGRIILPEGDDNNHALTGQLDIYHLPGR